MKSWIDNKTKNKSVNLFTDFFIYPCIPMLLAWLLIRYHLPYAIKMLLYMSQLHLSGYIHYRFYKTLSPSFLALNKLHISVTAFHRCVSILVYNCLYSQSCSLFSLIHSSQKPPLFVLISVGLKPTLHSLFLKTVSR